MSKAVTSAAAMMLVDEGKLSLDNPASTYLPALARVKVKAEDGLVAPVRAITVADLMRHTSGLPFFNDPAVTEVRLQAASVVLTAGVPRNLRNCTGVGHRRR